MLVTASREPWSESGLFRYGAAKSIRSKIRIDERFTAATAIEARQGFASERRQMRANLSFRSLCEALEAKESRL